VILREAEREKARFPHLHDWANGSAKEERNPETLWNDKDLVTAPYDCHHIDSVRYTDGMCKLKEPSVHDSNVMSKR
jgi:hypothetical protein